MPREILKLQNIAEIDNGRVAIAMNQALRAAQLDCMDRPTTKPARTVTLKMTLTPVAQDGHLVMVDVGFSIDSKVPTKKTLSYPMRPEAEGLRFETDSPKNPDQTSLPFGNNGEEQES